MDRWHIDIENSLHGNPGYGLQTFQCYSMVYESEKNLVISTLDGNVMQPHCFYYCETMSKRKLSKDEIVNYMIEHL